MDGLGLVGRFAWMREAALTICKYGYFWMAKQRVVVVVVGIVAVIHDIRAME